MSAPGKDVKRKLASDQRSISPPAVRRKVQSTTTKTAVASFFQPASQKPPERISWQERAPEGAETATLLVGRYEPLNAAPIGPKETVSSRPKIAAFDFDSTLITTSSGKKHSHDAGDWKWWHPSVPGALKKLHDEEGYIIAIISNQAGLALKGNAKAPAAHKARVPGFKGKVVSVFNQLNMPISVYAATEKDIFRKPRPGMWREVLKDNGISDPVDVDLGESFFVGDAGGRIAGPKFKSDFSSSDRGFADNVGIKFFTPEEYFLKEEPRKYVRFEPHEYVKEADAKIAEEPLYTRQNDQDIVLFVGSPGAGKSTFYEKYLKPLGYARINQDTLKTRDKCLKVASEELSEGRSVAIDNTNADPEVRSKWVALAQKHNVPIRCVLFVAGPEVCKHNDAVRALNSSMNPENRTMLPGLAFTGFASRYRKPELAEGFQDIVEVKFEFRGTEEERAIWTRYWT